MNIDAKQRVSSDKEKIFCLLKWGRNAGQRMSTGVFIYVKPKNHLLRNHNKEALMILETKRSQMILYG